MIVHALIINDLRLLLLLFINDIYELHLFSQPTRSTFLYTRRSNPENSVGASV